jgi:hypothetical protein
MALTSASSVEPDPVPMTRKVVHPLDSASMVLLQRKRVQRQRIVRRLMRLCVGPSGPSKVRTAPEGAQPFAKVRILENPDDSFEDAHPFTRCAPETAHLRGIARRDRPVRRHSIPINFSFFVEIVHGTAGRAPLIDLAAFLDGRRLCTKRGTDPLPARRARFRTTTGVGSVPLFVQSHGRQREGRQGIGSCV